MERERIIYILDYLKRNTNENKYVSLQEIQNYVEERCKTTFSTLTIRRDMISLERMNNKIIVKTGAHNKKFYSIVPDGFNYNEIRFLVDSVAINKFLSNEQKQNLFNKFKGMCSDSEVASLIKRIKLTDLIPENLDLLGNLETIYNIIFESRRIDFKYGKYDVKKKMKYYNKLRHVIPCQVEYFDDRFYLKCYDEDSKKVRVYRVDRMKDIKSGEKVKKHVIPKPEGTVIDMFEPYRYEQIKFKIRNFLIDGMLEKFGQNLYIRSIPEDNDNVIISAKIGISDSFYKWVMKYGGNIEILSPIGVRNEFIEELKKVCDIYNK